MGPGISVDSADIKFDDIILDKNFDHKNDDKNKFCDDWAIGFGA